MSVTSLPHRVLRFGVFEVDLRTAELRKYGVRIRLEEQPFQILSLLLESPGELVTREELRQRLWSADIFVDFDHALNKAISKLRLALGDSAENPRFIETLPRRGYRFITAVQSHDIPAISTLSEPEVKIQIPTPSTEGVRKGIQLVRSTRAIVAVIVILVLTIPFVLRRRQAAAAGSPAVTGTVVSRRSVAVLGF